MRRDCMWEDSLTSCTPVAAQCSSSKHCGTQERMSFKTKLHTELESWKEKSAPVRLVSLAKGQLLLGPALLLLQLPSQV